MEYVTETVHTRTARLTRHSAGPCCCLSGNLEMSIEGLDTIMQLVKEHIGGDYAMMQCL